MRARTLWVVAAAGLAGWWAYDALPRPSAGIAAAGGGFRFAWPAGTRYRYSLSYEAHNRTVPMAALPSGQTTGAAIEGDVRLAGELELRSYGRGHGPDGGDYLLGIALVSCSDVALTVGDQPILTGAAECDGALVGHEGYLRVSDAGELREVYDAEGTPPLARYLLQALATEIQVGIEPPQPRWELAEMTAHGEATSEYAVASDWGGGDAIELSRVRRQYASLRAAALVTDVAQDVAGRHEIRLARAGHLERLTGEESVRASAGGAAFLDAETTLRVELVAVDAQGKAPPSLASMTGHPPFALGDDARMHELLLRQRAGDLTIAEAAARIAAYGNGGKVPDHARFLWQVTALLELEPDGCAAIAAAFGSPDANHARRVLILDILAQTDHPAAQHALVGLLSAPETQADPSYVRYLQSAAFIQSPTPETVQFVTGELERGAGDAHTASAYTLGALSRKLARGGAEDAARAAEARLAQALADAEDPAQAAHYLRALGNSHREEHVEVYARYAGDDDARVRRAAARAAAPLESDAAREVLMALAADADDAVQNEAMRSLAAQELAGAPMARLAEMAGGGGIAARNQSHLVRLARGAWQADAQGARRVLEALLASGSIVNDSLRAEVHQLLAQRR